MNHQEDDNDDDKHNGPNKCSERYAKIKLVTVIVIIFGMAMLIVLPAIGYIG